MDESVEVEPHRGDAKRAGLPRSVLATILGVSPTGYANWVSEGLLPTEGPSGCSELVAMKAAVLLSLQAALGPEMGRIAFLDVKPHLEAGWFGQKKWDAVCDVARGGAVLAQTDAQLAEAVRIGRAVRVVELADEVRSVREAFRRRREARLQMRSRRGARRKVQ